MSVWTHVAATIRFDDIQGMQGEPQLGIIAKYGDPQDIWDKCDIPCGSEGSLEYTIWVNPDKSCIAAYTAMIWGDLRDYDNADEVIEYLNRICKGRMIRQGIAEIQVEGDGITVIRYDTKKGNWACIVELNVGLEEND